MKLHALFRTLAAILIMIALCCGLWYWSVTQIFTFPWVWEELDRFRSPSGTTEMVLYRGNRGAMSSFRYAYCLVQRGESADPSSDERGAFLVCRHEVAPEPQWINDHELAVSLHGTHVFHFDPRPQGFDVLIKAIPLEVEEVK